jgi:hypothetical protein
MPPSDQPVPEIPLLNIALGDVDGRPVTATMGGEGGLIQKRGVVRIDLTLAATLTLSAALAAVVGPARTLGAAAAAPAHCRVLTGARAA